MKELDDGLAESISSLIWVTPRLQADVQELKIVSDQLALKYGRPYAQVWPLTQFFLFPFCENSLIYLEGKSMTPHRGKTILFRSSQQLPRLRLGPSKGFLS